MTRKTNYNNITVPTEDDISDEDHGQWGGILNNETFDDYLDELAIARGPLSDRPNADSNQSSPDGTQDPIQRMWVVTDDTPPSLTISNGTEWITINQVQPRDRFFMSEYVDIGNRDGSTAVDTQFNSALSELAAGDTLVFDDGTYRLDNSHSIQKSITVECRDATIRCNNTSNNNATILFEGTGIQSSTTTAEAVIPGQTVVDVNDASIFSVDDRLLMMDDTYEESPTFDHGPIQFSSVAAVDTTNNQITLHGETVRNFVNGANVHQVNLLDGPQLKNVTTDGGGIRHLQFYWCERPVFEDCSISEYTDPSLFSLDCWKPRYFNVEATKPNGKASGEGEPVSAYRCSDALIDSPRVYNCRRGVDVAWGTHDCQIIDPVVHNFDIAGISVHGADECSFKVQGGTLVCSPSATTGNGISNAPNSPIEVDGTTMYCRRAGIRASGPCRASNVDFYPVENTNSGQAILVVASDVHIDNFTITDPNGLFGQPIEVNTTNGSIRDIDLTNFVIDYPNQNAIYLFTTGTASETITSVNITNGRIENAGDQSVHMLADAGILDDVRMDNVDIHGGTGQCVRLGGGTGSFGNLWFTDCHMVAGLAAIYDDTALGSNAYVQIHNSTFETGSTSLSFNDTYGILNISHCIANGSFDTSGTGTSNLNQNETNV